MKDEEPLSRENLERLLTQEARGAAERLQHGVQILEQGPVSNPGERAPVSERPRTLNSTTAEGEGLESTLEMLEDAMLKFTSPQSSPPHRLRKKRIDLAALIWELAPQAKVQLTPGLGTEILSEESELRHILQLLLSPSSLGGMGEATAIELRREAQEIRLSILLGPDVAPLSSGERRWISRMAMRLGARYELAGARECLVFPVEESAERKELDQLRRELAKIQGEKQVQEWTRIFSEPSLLPPPIVSTSDPVFIKVSNRQSLEALARIADAFAHELRITFAKLGTMTLQKTDANFSISEAQRVVRETFAKGAELLSLARQMARIANDSHATPINLFDLVREQVAHGTLAFASKGITVSVKPCEDNSSRFAIVGYESALRALIAELLNEALLHASNSELIHIFTAEQTIVIQVQAASAQESFAARMHTPIGFAFAQEIAMIHQLKVEHDLHRWVLHMPNAEPLLSS